MRPVIEFRFVMRKIKFKLLSIAGEMKSKFVSGVVGAKQHIKKVKKRGI